MLIDKTQRPIRDTGGSDTSLGNSTVMMYAWWWVCQQMIEQEDFSIGFVMIRFAGLGLEMKIKLLDLEDATFLKGMWYHTVDGPFWGPLCSRVVKMGKSIKDPRTLYAGRLTLRHAAELFLSDVANSYVNYLRVPLIRVHIDNFMKHPKQLELLEPHQIAAASCPKPRLVDAAYQQIIRRYKFTLEDLLEAEELYPLKPFQFTSSPIYEAMVVADYS